MDKGKGRLASLLHGTQVIYTNPVSAFKFVFFLGKMRIRLSEPGRPSLSHRFGRSYVYVKAHASGDWKAADPRLRCFDLNHHDL